MIQKSSPRSAVAMWMALVLLAVSAAPAWATTDKPKKASAPKQGSTKFVPGSQETKKERETRLKRECKGQVNAGACAGYTH